MGTLELRVPQDRRGGFSTEIFERYQRREKALVAALVEMDVQGFSPREVKAMSEEWSGHEFSASTISELNGKLDAELERFARQALAGEYPCRIVEARSEEVREEGVIRARAVLVAKASDDCLTELRWLYDLGSVTEARLQLRAWREKWSAKHPKLCAWVEESIEETWTFSRRPREHHKHLKSTNLLERRNQELKRRTHVVRIFPNQASCLRLIRALACAQHEEWLDGPVYLDLQALRDQLKPSLQLAA